MGRVLFACVCCFLLLSWSDADIPEHEVLHLPGWAGTLPSRQYSGLIPVANGTKHLHYWFVLSEGAPERDPVALWLNGGPGASSLLGLFTEMGQLVLNDDSMRQMVHGVPALQYNPYGWSQAANMLYIESPAGVGFSYCEGDKPCEHTDESTASDMADFFEAFVDKYSEFAEHRYYLTGESYAGVYLPMLAEQLLVRLPGLDLRGLAAGNGCWGNQVGLCSDSGDAMSIIAQFFHAHSMFDDALWEEMREHCDWYNVSAACVERVAEMRKQIGSLNIYNVYDTCADDTANTDLSHWLELSPASGNYRLRWPLGAGMNSYKCGGETAMAAYLSIPKVAEALHVKPAGSTPSMGNYNRTVADLRPLYRRLSDEMRVLIYSGDVDGCVPTHGTETFFLRTLGLNITSAWAPWSAFDMDGAYMKAGYFEHFGGTKYGIDFVTFNGAGHMVPTYKPAEALTLMKRWLNDEDVQQEAEHDAHFTSVPAAIPRRPTETVQVV